jgi:hypothetical protein
LTKNKNSFKLNTQPTKDQMTKIPKIAIYVSGGIVQGVRSNMGQDLEVEVVDADNDPDTAEEQWMELQEKLEFGNY